MSIQIRYLNTQESLFRKALNIFNQFIFQCIVIQRISNTYLRLQLFHLLHLF